MRLYQQKPETTEVVLIEEVDVTTPLGELVEIDVEEFLWLEDVEEPIDRNQSIEVLVGVEVLFVHVHVNRCQQVEVRVKWNGRVEGRSFIPAATLERVLDWAVSAFGIDPVEVPDLVLRLTATGPDLNLRDHVGSLTQPGRCEVELLLLPGHRHAG